MNYVRFDKRFWGGPRKGDWGWVDDPREAEAMERTSAEKFVSSLKKLITREGYEIVVLNQREMDHILRLGANRV